MDNTITIEQIEATITFSLLSATQRKFAVKRENRKLLTNALIIVSNGQPSPGTITGYNIGILNDLVNTK